MRGKVLAVLAETIDEIEGRKRLGGPAYYSSLALLSLGVNFDALLTGSVMRAVLESSGLAAYVFCSSPTIFEFISTEPRLLKLLSKCSSNLPAPLPGYYDVALVSLTMGEAPVTDLCLVAEHTETLLIDTQGYVRDVSESSTVFNNVKLAARLFEVAASISESGTSVIIKASHDELPSQEHIRRFVETGGALIITRGRGSVTLFTNHGCWSTKPPYVAGDPTGAGDVMLAVIAAYLASGRDLRQATLLGAAAGSIRLAKKEPPWILWSEIESLARRLSLVECGGVGDSPDL